MLKCGGPTFPTCENSVIQCVVDPQVKEMRRVAQLQQKLFFFISLSGV